MRIFQLQTSSVAFRVRVETLRTLDQGQGVTPLVDCHLTVDTLEPVLLDGRDPPDHLVAGLTEGWLAEVGFHELVAFDGEKSLYFIPPPWNVLGRHREDFLLLHVDRQGDGATRGELLD